MTKMKTTKELFSKNIVEANSRTFENLEYYKKISELIDRTKTALGKNEFYVTSNCSTSNSNINTNAIGSTQKIQNLSGLE